MANPAELLLETFERWNNTPSRKRGFDQPGRHSVAVAEHEVAMGHVAQIRELLGILESAEGISVAIYRKYLPNWTMFVLAYPDGWSQPAAIEGAPIEHLETLGGWLRRVVPPVSDDSRDDLSDALNELADLLKQDTTIPRDMGVHLAGLVSHMRTVLLEYETRGDFDLRRAVDMLFAAVEYAGHASRADEETRNRWQSLRMRFLIPAIVPGAIETASVIAQLMLGM